MAILKTAVLVLALGVTTAVAQGTSPEGVVRANAGQPIRGSSETFVGSVEVRQVVTPQAPGRSSIGAVTFSPGARSNWHTHPAGQALHVVDGCGWTQRQGGPVVRICKGDTAYVPPGVKHWHGATSDETMTHLAITESVDGRNVDWMEPVSDDAYRAGAKAVR